VAPYEEKEDSQSYYFENSDEEDMKTAALISRVLKFEGEVQTASAKAKQPKD
jgi:hypothetical protein